MNVADYVRGFNDTGA